MTMSNAAFTVNPQFRAACEKAKEIFGLDIQPTAAQASKYRRGYGAAYNAEHGQPLGSKANYRTGGTDSQRSMASPGKINDYGPYSSTPRNNKPAPHPSKK